MPPDLPEAILVVGEASDAGEAIARLLRGFGRQARFASLPDLTALRGVDLVLLLPGLSGERRRDLIARLGDTPHLELSDAWH